MLERVVGCFENWYYSTNFIFLSVYDSYLVTLTPYIIKDAKYDPNYG